jgi:hypothetical protein
VREGERNRKEAASATVGTGIDEVLRRRLRAPARKMGILAVSLSGGKERDERGECGL